MRKKFLSLILATLLTCCFAVALAGCNGKNNKYDVAIIVGCYRIKNDRRDSGLLEAVTFPVGTDEQSVERAYDGNEYIYAIYQYNLPEHPEWGNKWFSPDSSGANVFGLSVVYRDYYSDDKACWQKSVDSRLICERGEYCVTITAEATSDLWQYHRWDLYIAVK